VKEYLGKYYFVHPLSFILPVASGVTFDRVLFGLANNDTEFTARLLQALGYDNSMVVNGHDGEGRNLDEISNIGPTKITEIRNGEIKTREISPGDLGFTTANYSDIKNGNSVAENAEIFLNLISGKDTTPRKDIVLMNSGALIYISGMVNSITDGICIAAETINTGKAAKLLVDFIEVFRHTK